MMRKLLILFVLVIGVGLIAFIWTRFDTPSPDELLVFGNIEVTEVDVSFKLPGKVIKRFVDEGDLVQERQLIAILDRRELLEEVEARKAVLLKNQAYLKELSTGNLPRDIIQAEALLEEAQANFDRIEADYLRQQALLQDQVISQREYDVSASSFLAAKAELMQTEESLSLLKSQISEERIRQAEAQVNQSRNDLAIAESRLSDGTIFSPLTGWVLSKNVESGEVVSAGTPIVTIANLKDIWFRAYVDERDLGKVKLGQKVRVTSDTYPDKIYPGIVTFISQESEFTPKNVETKKERVKLVYRIKVTLDNLNDELKPGMPAEGVIDLRT